MHSKASFTRSVGTDRAFWAQTTRHVKAHRVDVSEADVFHGLHLCQRSLSGDCLGGGGNGLAVLARP